MPEYRKPPCQMEKDNIIGKGGNGKVYITSDLGFVCKVFNVDDEYSVEKKEKRYKRFCYEIKIQQEVATKIKGVLPIEDFDFPEYFNEQRRAWYTMPKARKFDIKKDKSIADKIRDLIELGQILSELHSLGMAHRDVKPENILIYKKHIYLADFGLVWVDGESELTDLPERMGPIKIIPPELESCEDINGCDYRKSDVYLFSKVAWMYLKGDKGGFKGPYNRSANQIFLNNENYTCKSLEPFHLMMEQATKDDWSKRIEISDCLDYLRKQYLIANDMMPDEELRKYIFQEKFLYFERTVSPDVIIYKETGKIRALLDSVIPGATIEFVNIQGNWIIKPIKFRWLSEKTGILYEEQPDESIKKTLFNVSEVEVHEDKIIIKTAVVEQNDLDPYQKKQYIIINEKTTAVIRIAMIR